MKFKITQDKDFDYVVERVDWRGLFTNDVYFSTLELAEKYVRSQLNPRYYTHDNI